MENPRHLGNKETLEIGLFPRYMILPLRPGMPDDVEIRRAKYQANTFRPVLESLARRTFEQIAEEQKLPIKEENLEKISLKTKEKQLYMQSGCVWCAFKYMASINYKPNTK